MSTESIVQESPAVPAAEVNGVSAPATIEKTEPSTPGEAAKEARLRGELHARQQRLKKHTDELHKTRAAFEEEKRQWAEQRAKADEEGKATIAQLQKEIKELREGNPLTRMSGEQANAALREFVDSGAPEVQIRKLQKALEDRDAAFEAYKREQSEASKAREAAEQRAREDSTRTAEQNQFRHFVQQVTSGEHAKTFKFLNAEMTQSQIFSEVNKIVEAGKQVRWTDKNGVPRVGKYYTGQEIAEYLEKVCEKSYNDRMTRLQGLGLMGAPSAASNPAEKGSKSQVSQPANGNGSNGGNKFQKKQLSKQEQEAQDLDLLRKAMAKDDAARKAANKK